MNGLWPFYRVSDALLTALRARFGARATLVALASLSRPRLIATDAERLSGAIYRPGLDRASVAVLRDYGKPLVYL